MDRRALVSVFGAAGMVSCISGMSAQEIRNAGRIHVPESVGKEVLPTSRIESCVAMGQTQFEGLSVRSEIESMDLSNLDCGDCRVKLSLVVPDGWRAPSPHVPPMEEQSSLGSLWSFIGCDGCGVLEEPIQVANASPTPFTELRIGYVYGSLTIHAPSDSILEKIRDICSSWAASVPSYAQACEWRRVGDDLWQSGVFATRITDDEPRIAEVDFDSAVRLNESRAAPHTLPRFNVSAELEIETGFAPVYAAFMGFSGRMSFVPQIVEVVNVSDGKILGCLPVDR